MPAWGDFVDAGVIRVGSADHESTDPQGYYAATVAAVHQCIDALRRDDAVPSQRIAIGGFSQGAASAAECALSYHQPLAGCMLLSGWLSPSARSALAYSENRRMEWLVCHGTADELVAVSCGELAVRALRDAGAGVQCEFFEGVGHTESKCGGQARGQRITDFLQRAFKLRI